MKPTDILLVPVLPVDEWIIPTLISPLEKEFQRSVSISDEIMDASFAHDISRQQYNSTIILASFQNIFNEGVFKALGVTSADLYVPVLTYVFGEAQLDGRFGVVSLWRLDNALYGLSENKNLLVERLVKEAVHEMGHIYGLFHCRNYECVMHSSTAVDDIDVKDSVLCEQCKSIYLNKI